MEVVHIYGARAIFLLFYDNQDTESESRGIEMGEPRPIFIHKNNKGSIEKNIHTPQYRRRELWYLFIFTDIEPFCNFFVITKTLNLSHLKYK